MDKLNGEIEDIERRKEQISEQLEQSDSALSRIEDERSTAIQSLVLGKITEAQFDEMRKKHEQAKQNREDYAEMLDVASDNILKLANERAELARKEEECRRVFWMHVSNILIEEAIEDSVVIRACISYDLTSGHLRPGDFFEDKIMRRLTKEDYEKIRLALIEQYTK